MKTFGTILVVLLVLLALLGVGLQVFLTKGLTSALNKGVFPVVKAMYGLQMDIENASVNILKGTAELRGFSTRNLKGYQKPFLLRVEECRMELDMMSLLKRDPIVINEAKAVGALLVVERNQDKRINVKELADALKPIESTEQPPAADPAPTEKTTSVPIHIRRMIADLRVLYADSRSNREYPLNLTLTASDIFSVPVAGQPSSLIVLRGALADNQNSFVTDLSATVEPLIHPAQPSFRASGSILDIDADFLRELLENNHMKSGAFSLRPSIRCQQGQLEDSFVDLTIQSLEIHNAQIGEAKLKLPIISKAPWIDLPGALNSLLSEQSLDIGKVFGLNALKQETGADLSGSPQEALMETLTNRVEKINETPALQNLLQQVLPGTQPTNQPATNQPTRETLGDAVIETLEENVNELKDNEAVKDLLRGFFK